MLGPIPHAVDTVPHQYPECDDESKLRHTCRSRNEGLVGLLRADPNVDYLHKQTLEDAECGRMTTPVPVAELALDEVLLCRRFGREQGDGSPKVRAVDDESGNVVNGCARQLGKVTWQGHH